MDKQQRANIVRPYLIKCRNANALVKSLKEDPSYIAHLEKIRGAEKEAAECANELSDILWSL